MPIGFKSFITGDAAINQDPRVANGMNEVSSIDIAVAGDLLGHLIGTLSHTQGTRPLVNTTVEVSGHTPSGTWTRRATTNENGFFQIDFPLGSTGPVDIAATSDGHTIKATIDSGDIAVSLTPRSQTRGSRVSLEGRWDFAVDPSHPTGEASAASSLPEPPYPSTWSSIEVPSHWEMAGFKAETGSAVYRRAITIPHAWQGKRIKFRSDGIYSRAEVWLNGRRIGGHDGGSTPFELDITDATKPGTENSIYILARDSSDAGNLDGMSYFAHLSMGGIWRPLEVFCVEPAHIARIVITTNFDPIYQDAELSAHLDIVNEQTKEIKDAALKLECVDPDGKPVSLEGLSAKVSLGPWERKRITLKTKVTRPEQWSAETPRLYKLKAELDASYQRPAAIEQPFGFREIEIKGRTYLINGKPIKMWGAGRLDSHPLMARAITSEIAKQDVELMKGANLNAMRTTTYLQHPAAFDAADELGLYVEDEGPFCFVGVSYGPPTGRNRNLSKDLRLAPLTIRETSEMLERDRNHPSVVIWSICNESSFGRIFQMAHKFVRESDPTRPTSAGQSANLEIATYHNPTSMQRIRDTADLQMPVFFDEALCIFQGFNTQAQGLELDPGLRDFWITAHFEPFNAIVKSDHHLGTQIWAWVDDAFLVPGRGIEYGRLDQAKSHVVDGVYAMPGRGIVGEPIWGIIEGWRRVRPEWWLSKKLFSPIHIKEEPLQPATPINIPVENRNFFADLNRYVCKWRLAEESGELTANVPPQTSGVIAISPRKAPRPSDILTVEFFDEHKKLIDGYKLAFQARDISKATLSGKPARIVEEPAEMALTDGPNVSFVCLKGTNCTLAFDRTSGGLIRGVANNQQVLLAGPRLHVMKSYAALEAYPAGWHVASEKHGTDSGMAILNWNGSYGDQFTGGFVIRMDDAGNVEIDYSFTYSGAEVLAREIGLGLDVPLSCDHLEWDRKAEWSYYPDDHIGRPHGVAVAHPNVPQTVPPKERPFGLDDHPWGCNDFRGVKRNVYWASLTGPDGSGIRVLSNGHQHVRATVSNHSIGIKILDYYGGSATGANEWDGAYGNGHAIKAGDVLKGAVRLELLPGTGSIPKSLAKS